MAKKVYFFTPEQTDGDATLADLLGGKGAGLAEMSKLGLPVPPGFTIPTHECLAFAMNGFTLQDDLKKEIETALTELGRIMNASFGNAERPLLVSVRSGARASMPGMMDTILNLGMNDTVCEGLGKRMDNLRFSKDTYRRFIEMYASVVARVDRHLFEDQLDAIKKSAGKELDSDLDSDELGTLIQAYKIIFRKETGESFPQDPFEQLWKAIAAVFESWNSTRAKKYREIHKIPDDWGTAVNICTMVYGNMGPSSGTGVCFTRNPSTGENTFYGEYLTNAQGEDVVAGIRTPKPLDLLAAELPESYAQLVDVRHKLERHYGDVQDIEFTIQEGKLFLLQTRKAKRTTAAALKIATSFVEEGILTKEEALMRLNAAEIERLLHPTLDPRAHRQVIAKGLPASPGAIAGRIVFNATDAEIWATRGEAVVLVREETSPEDIGGMHASKGFLTARGGMTSHAAVVARQMGKTCVAGCSSMRIYESRKTMEMGTVTLNEGDWITLDGSTGEVMMGKVATQEAGLGPDLGKLIRWAGDIQTMKVRANADTPHDAKIARSFGAQGIGLCRTEHMFFDEERLPLVRHMILSISSAERNRALDELLPHQQSDFEQLFATMSGYPVTVRLLDPPLHEFLPHPQEDLSALARQIGISAIELKERIHQMSEQNPMLGHRGCRLGISQPAIYEMQVRAIARAAVSCILQGLDPKPEIMIPLVGLASELVWLRKRLECICMDELQSGLTAVKDAHGLLAQVPTIPFGTMIEVPRAALTADEIAAHADFFSFGTNDLTQTTFGFSRDDSASFLRIYEKEQIIKEDPFSKIDIAGVGKLLEMTTNLGRKTKPDLKIGICGEQAGDPESILYLQKIGLDYVSCSPFRVPIAQVAAGQAAIIARNEAAKK